MKQQDNVNSIRLSGLILVSFVCYALSFLPVYVLHKILMPVFDSRTAFLSMADIVLTLVSGLAFFTVLVLSFFAELPVCMLFCCFAHRLSFTKKEFMLSLCIILAEMDIAAGILLLFYQMHYLVWILLSVILTAVFLAVFYLKPVYDTVRYADEYQIL